MRDTGYEIRETSASLRVSGNIILLSCPEGATHHRLGSGMREAGTLNE